MPVKIEEIASEFLELKNVFDKIGFELIGTKDIKIEILYVVREKKRKDKYLL